MANTEEPKDEIFHSLSSTQERLMREMNDYLAAIQSHPSPGEETACSVDTRKVDNTSSKPLSAKLKVPSMEVEGGSSGIANSNADGDVNQVKMAGKERTVGGVKTNSVRSSGNNLISIDEDGGGEHATNVPQQYEYFDDFDNPDCIHYDDDSLVAMAKRMDAASIISDPSLICGPKEKKQFLLPALPGMKRLVGQRGKPPPPPPPRTPPPRNVNVGQGGRPSPRPSPPPIRNAQQQQYYQPIAINNTAPSAETLVSIPRRVISTLSSEPPSSCKESIEFAQDDRCGPSMPSADDGDHGISEQTLVPHEHAREMESSANTGRRNSLFLEKEVREHNKARSLSSGRKSTRYPSSPSPNTAPRRGDYVDEPSQNFNYIPDAYAAEKTGAGRKKTRSKSRRRSSSKKRKGSKKGKKKWHKDQRESESDDESMHGVGFNTRIRRDSKPQNLDDIEPKKPADGEIGVRSRTKQSREKPSRAATKSSERGTDNGQSSGESSESPVSDVDHNGGGSEYDSDDQTQIFYESTDDDDDDFYSDDDSSEEEPILSVADAVKDLNDRRAVTKVKNLFGIRG